VIYSLQNELILRAKKLVYGHFFESTLRQCSSEYIEYKFNDSTRFANITLVHYEIFQANQNEEEKQLLLTIIELLMLSLDIMDDIQDEDFLEGPWTKHPIATNLNIIMGFLLICLQEVDKSSLSIQMKNWLKNEIHSCILNSINGQQLDLKNEIHSEKDYIDMVTHKSGYLIKLACLLGTGNINPIQRSLIENYAICIGVINQIKNDMRDIMQWDKKNDFLNLKKTLPILYYLNSKNDNFILIKKFFNQEIQYDELNNQALDSLKHILLYGGSMEYCSVMQNLYVYKSKRYIEQLSLSQANKDRLIGTLL